MPAIETLREAVQHVAHDEELFTRVTDMQQNVREAGGAVTAAQAIEACLRDS
ncbi:hypothetical protein ACT91Q_03420 [Brevibacillus thermoruber]